MRGLLRLAVPAAVGEGGSPRLANRRDREVHAASYGAYDFSEVYELAREFGFTCHVRSRGEEAQAIKHEADFRARRWVVERTQSWLNRFRRLFVRWEKRADTYLAMLHLACGLVTWHTVQEALPK